MQLTSLEWGAAYQYIWNHDEIIREKLKKFNIVFQYAISDRRDKQPIIIEVEKGKIIRFGHDNQEFGKVKFDIWANSHNWLKVLNQELSIKQAVKDAQFKFKGSKLKVLKNISGLSRSVQILTEMPGVRV